MPLAGFVQTTLSPSGLRWGFIVGQLLGCAGEPCAVLGAGPLLQGWGQSLWSTLLGLGGVPNNYRAAPRDWAARDLAATLLKRRAGSVSSLNLLHCCILNHDFIPLRSLESFPWTKPLLGDGGSVRSPVLSGAGPRSRRVQECMARG